MNRIRHAVVPALILVIAGKQALTISAASRQPHREVPIQVILRLADPPVSAVAPPAASRGPRVRISASEVSREQSYCRHLKALQELLTRRLAAEQIRVIARYQVAFNGICVEARPSVLSRLSHNWKDSAAVGQRG